MTTRAAHRDGAEHFSRSIGALADARVRSEVVLEEGPAPQRIAPFSTALTAEVTVPGSDEPAATGRFIVLHDPDEPEAWSGAWRIVTYASARLEAELGADPLLGEVGWSWLSEQLEAADVAHRCLGGTVTRVVSERFGVLADDEPDVELEMRASWTVEGEDLAAHLGAWTDLLCTLAGLPPLPEGVVPLPGLRR